MSGLVTAMTTYLPAIWSVIVVLVVDITSPVASDVQLKVKVARLVCPSLEYTGAYVCVAVPAAIIRQGSKRTDNINNIDDSFFIVIDLLCCVRV